MSLRFSVSRPVEAAAHDVEWPGRPVKYLVQTNLDRFVLPKKERQTGECSDGGGSDGPDGPDGSDASRPSSPSEPPRAPKRSRSRN